MGSPERMSEKGKSPRKKHSPNKTGEDSDDEMSEKKRKLLSRVLAPAKKSRHASSGMELEEEKRLTIDIEEEMLRKLRKKEKKQKKREKRRKLLELEERLKENHEIKHEHDENDLDDDYVPANSPRRCSLRRVFHHREHKPLVNTNNCSNNIN